MKIAQFYHHSMIRLGLIQSGRIVPIDFSGDMIALIKSRKTFKTKGNPISLKDVKLAPPITAPSKIIAIGLNYKDHAEESKGKIPEVPLIFAKFPNSIDRKSVV